VSRFFLCEAIYAAGCGFAPVGARSRATGVAHLKTVFSGSVIRRGWLPEGPCSSFLNMRRRSRKERVPTGCIRGPRGCTGLPSSNLSGTKRDRSD